MKTENRGQILPIVMAILVVLVLIIGGLVSWLQIDSQWSVNNQKKTVAINLAQAGLDRAQWKLQSSTATWLAAAAGNLNSLVAGYNFDITYTDIPGGSYRILITSGPSSGGSCTPGSCVTIISEGRDNSTNQVRAVSSIYKNQTIYSAMMSGGNVSWAQGLGIYWGPIITQGSIQLMDDNVARRYFPQKFAKGDVIGTAANPRDVTYPQPPNTDNAEWWANYPGVPGVPLLDFAAMRSSAAATGTLNVYGCGCAAVPQYTVNGVTVAAWDTNRNAGTCANDGDTAPHNTHLGNSTNIYGVLGLDPNQDYVWYWDGDVALQGDGYNGSNATSLRGTIVVRGDLTINSSGDMVYSGHVPANAWMQEQRLLINTNDTAAWGEYPGDIGFHQSTGTFHFGVDSWCEPGLGCGWVNTVGIQGFVYVGGDLNIVNFLDINGAVWVNGNVVSNYNNPSAFCGLMYDDTLNVPALNVILLRQSWQEVPASSTPWH
jgi:hypothetical protein